MIGRRAAVFAGAVDAGAGDLPVLVGADPIDPRAAHAAGFEAAERAFAQGAFGMRRAIRVDQSAPLLAWLSEQPALRREIAADDDRRLGQRPVVGRAVADVKAHHPHGLRFVGP